jgi:hypothetical protein
MDEGPQAYALGAELTPFYSSSRPDDSGASLVSRVAVHYVCFENASLNLCENPRH